MAQRAAQLELSSQGQFVAFVEHELTEASGKAASLQTKRRTQHEVVDPPTLAGDTVLDRVQITQGPIGKEDDRQRYVTSFWSSAGKGPVVEIAYIEGEAPVVYGMDLQEASPEERHAAAAQTIQEVVGLELRKFNATNPA